MRLNFLIVILFSTLGAFRGGGATVLGVAGTRFTINDQTQFLFGISYYGGLGAGSQTLARDLAKMQTNHLNWLRVWANWSSFSNNLAAVDAEGRAREPYLSRLQNLVAACDSLGLVVDVTLSRGEDINGVPRLANLEGHQRAVAVLIQALAGHRNWYLDLANERNVRDKRFASFEDLTSLRAQARRLSPTLLVTASHSPDLSREEVRRYLQEVKVDFLAPHRPRSAESPAQTAEQTQTYLQLFQEIGRAVPVLYQEPFRRGYTRGWNPTAQDFLADASGARQAGAAGWCFHNGDQRGTPDGRPRRSFDLTEKSIFDQLDPEEVTALGLLRSWMER